MGKKLALILSILALCPAASLAQVATATLQGTVKDQTGAAIPGVSVTVIHTDTGTSRNVLTDEAGRYVATQLPIGAYEVRAELAGFQTTVRRGITLTVGMQGVVDLALSVGEVRQIVEVIGGALAVDTTSSAISELVDSKTMQELPLNGRNFVQLATLQMGVVASDRVRGNFPLTSGTGMKINVNGARDSSNSFLLDGQDIQDVFNSTPASGGGETLGVDTLAEFEVKTANFSAEYSKAAGAVISAVTKSGTNELHGNVFEFLRNDNLDAANFFDNAFNNAKPEFRRNQFGATLGGPIIRNKTFFFGGYEGLREARGFTQRFVVPSNNARQGLVVNSEGQLEQVAISPAIRPILDAMFLPPNGRDLGNNLAERIETRTRVKNEDFFVVKVDHKLSDSDRVSVRYSFTDGRFSFPSGQVFTQIMPSRNQSVSVQEQKTFSPTVVNTFRVGFNRSDILEDDVPLVDIPEVARFVPFSDYGIIGVSGLSPAGNGNLRPRNFKQDVYEFNNTTAITRSGHVIKFGGQIQRFHAFFDQNPFQKGIYQFGGVRQFLEGLPTTFQGPRTPFESVRDFRQTLFGFFAQDDVRVRPGFTLNLGLRYEFITVPTEVEGRLANLRSLDATEIVIGDPYYENPGLLNFAPRVGLAWDVFGDGKTSLRSGFGVFHNQILPNMYRTYSLGNAPFGGGTFQTNPPFPNAFSTAVPSSVLTASSIPFEPEQPTTYQWNLTIQREVLDRTVVSAGYVGTRGVHLPWGISGQDQNIAVPTIIDGRKFYAPNLPRRNPNFSTIATVHFNANSFYHGFQMGVRRQSASGAQFQVSYTLAKSIDEASGLFGGNGDFMGSPSAQDPLDRRAERAPSAFDARHTLVANAVYPLPFRFANRRAGVLLNGWQVNTIVNLSTGLPFTVLADNTGDPDRDRAVTAIRPDLVPGASNNPIIGDPNRWFNPSAFAVPQPGFYGNLGRNTLRGDGFQTVDVGLTKNTPITERVSMQFRTEFFNIFNHANFQIPSVTTIFLSGATMPRSDAGQVTSTANPARQIQFSAKLVW